MSSSRPLPTLQRLLTLPFVVLVMAASAMTAMVAGWDHDRTVGTMAARLAKESLRRIGQAVDAQMQAHSAGLSAAIAPAEPGPADIADRVDELIDDLWAATSLYSKIGSYVFYATELGQFIGLKREANSDKVELRMQLSPEEQRIFYRVESRHAIPKYGRAEKVIYDARTRPWYQAAIHAQGESWSPVYINFTTPKLVMTLARPVHDENGRLIGVVGTDVWLDALDEFLRSMEISRSGVAFIVDAAGNLIASSSTDSVRIGPDGPKRVAANDSGNALVDAAFSALDGRQARFTIAEPGSRSFRGPSGDHFVSGFARLTNASGLTWDIVVAVPQEEFAASRGERVLRALMQSLLAGAIAAALGMLVVRRVARDARALADGVRHIGDGAAELPRLRMCTAEMDSVADGVRDMHRKLRTDQLTGLANREEVLARLAERMSERRRATDTGLVGVLFIDLDDFKSINDRFGHDLGDRVLMDTAQRLRACVRATDLVARWSGDEFVVLLDQVPDLATAECVRAKVERFLEIPVQIAPGQSSLRVAGSVGLATHPGTASGPEALVRLADESMYRRKKFRAGVQPSARAGNGNGPSPSSPGSTIETMPNGADPPAG